jgi:glycerophosphoryl diester phosphodiesterase
MRMLTKRVVAPQQPLGGIFMKQVKYVAHRGLNHLAPENTLPAFEWAARKGMWGIECDTYCTVDGSWIVHHDRTVDRMTNGTGKAQDFTLEQIRNLQIVSGSNLDSYPGLKIPTLEEVLAVCRHSHLHAFIEIELYHSDADIETLVRLVESSGMMDRCSFICFQEQSLETVRRLHPDVPLGWLTGKEVGREQIELVKRLGNAFLNVQYERLSADFIRQCREEGIEVSAWIVNTWQEAEPLIAAGIDYITTDVVLQGPDQSWNP